MSRKEQNLAAGVIYGVIALFLLACASVGAHAICTNPFVAPAIVPATALFGLLGCFATIAAVYAFNSALEG